LAFNNASFNNYIFLTADFRFFSFVVILGKPFKDPHEQRSTSAGISDFISRFIYCVLCKLKGRCWPGAKAPLEN